ncbi:hypothetical protein EDB89DRAFT_1859018, partial [Lactarius sanguifluus]
LEDNIKIAEDGEAVRILGAWLGNHADDVVPWEPVLDKTKRQLDNWEEMRPTLYGKRLIVQAVVGGHSQFLTMAQGMPKSIETALTKMIRNFIWGEDAPP